jgi:uncharacterized surface protein with fasciclin (FAS1) repeats
MGEIRFTIGESEDLFRTNASRYWSLTPFLNSKGPGMSAKRTQNARPRRLVTALSGVVIAASGLLGTSAIAAPQLATIPEVAVSSGRLDTLVAAVKAAGLAEALSGEGPFTVFAPTDDAFALLGKQTLSSLLTEEGRPTLARILKHHVVVGRFEARDLVDREGIETLAGTTLPLATARGRLLVDEAVVETANVGASNGIVHIIDRVLVPVAETSPAEALLEIAVERGAPLFNEGNIDGCAAIYATALDAISLAGDFGLDEKGRANLAKRLAEIAKETSSRDRAWAYRAIIDGIFAGEMAMQTTSATPAPTERSGFAPRGNLIFGFDDAKDGQRWQTVLDGVMGGRSTGKISQADGVVVFDGATSLQNNGGFSSMRAGIPKGLFDGADAIRLIVKGDGRDYKIGASTGGNQRSGGYWKTFPTTKDTWTEVIMPVADLERQFMGQRLNGTASPGDLRALQIYIYDKKAGPFRLEIESIEAVETKGNETFDA